MRRILCLSFILLALIAPDCQTKTKDSGTINVTGTVTHYDLEGGFWAIKGDDGKTYDPVAGLPTEFQTEGLRVDSAALDAIGRLGGPMYTHVTKESVFNLPRPQLPAGPR